MEYFRDGLKNFFHYIKGLTIQGCTTQGHTVLIYLAAKTYLGSWVESPIEPGGPRSTVYDIAKAYEGPTTFK